MFGRRTRLHRVRLVAAVGVSLGLAAITLPVVADQTGSGAVISEQAAPDCPPGQRALERADDRFAQGCLPGQDIARLDDSGARLGVGETARDNMRLIANLPKVGAFAPEDAFNSDLAFKGKYAFAGNYNGFAVYDVSTPTDPRLVTQVFCPGSQNDVSVRKQLLILSTDSSRTNDSCRNRQQPETVKSSWEGIKVFDISNPARPRYVAAVETACGSHTHTLAPDGQDLYVYVSSYSPNRDFPDCQPPHDQISVVRVPFDAPQDAELASTPVLFPRGGNPGTTYTSETSGCHDITAYPRRDIAAGACMGDGILLDISNRARPRVTERTRDNTNFAFWHSATFNNAGTKVVFTDELGGGGAPTCNPTIGRTKGANGIYDIVEGDLVHRSYYKMPRTQTNTENCVAHNGSLIPVPGRDIMVQAWYQGGVSVFDFTNSARPREIAYFDRGPLSASRLVIGGNWSAYWYNGYVFSTEIQRGFDVFKIRKELVPGASRERLNVFNAQSQPSFNG